MEATARETRSALLEGGADDESPLSATLARLREHHEDLLKRASVPRTLDPAVLDAITGDGAAALETLTRLGLVEGLPGQAGAFRLNDTVRKHELNEWSRDAAPGGERANALVDIHRALVEHYERRGDELEGLYHRFPVDRADAVARFERLYAKADEAFDLTRCRDFLDVFAVWLSVGPSLPGKEESLLWSEYQAYLDARGAWQDDWYRSGHFVAPAESEQPIKRLLEGKDGRVLHMWGRGGLGKTTHLRWLIARRCVPKPNRIACARIDFDAIEATAALEQRWLLLIEIAAQLDGQLRDHPFNDLLKQFGTHRARLWPPAYETRLEPRPLSSLAGAEVSGIPKRFRSVLKSLDERERVVVVLDTLEVALDNPRPDAAALFDGLLRMLAEVHDGTDPLRLVLAGRYDLRERPQAFVKGFPGAGVLQLTGFTSKEAARYLSQERSIADPVLVEAGVEASAQPDGHMPFKLALIADVIDQKPTISPEEIRRSRDHDMLYLVRRVLERVDPEIRWVLRYGVVPRTLDEEFLREVILPVRAGAGEDRPAADALPAGAGYPPDLWAAGDTTLDAQLLWARLSLYVGEASWVELDHRYLDTLRFHVDVVKPMRRLLAGQPIFAELQRAACRHFELRATSTPQQAGRWLREALFHRFQLEGGAAVEYWRALMTDAAAPELAETRRQLAGELLATDDQDGPPWPRDAPRIPRQLRVEASFELAWATAQVAWAQQLPPTTGAWREVKQHLAVLERDAQDREPDAAEVADPARIALLQGLLRLAELGPEQADEDVRVAVDGAAPLEDRLWLAFEHAGAFAAHAPGVAQERYKAAFRLADESKQRLPWRRRLHVALARVALERDDHQAAQLEITNAGRRVRDVEVRLLHVDLLLRMGRPRRALAVTRPTEKLPTHERPALLRAHARALLASGHAARALESLEHARRDALKSMDASGMRRELAEVAQLTGEAHAQLLDVDAASRAFSGAVELWREADDHEGLCRVYLRRAAFQLRTLGNLSEAATELAHAMRHWPTTGSSEWVELMVLCAEHTARSGELADARRGVDAALGELKDRNSVPRRFIAVALAGLALGEPSAQAGYAQILCEQLERVTPASSRLALLEPLSRCPELLPWQLTDGGARLRAAVPCRAERRVELDDVSPLLGLVDAELDRVVGKPGVARKKLLALKPLASSGGDVVLKRWLEALERVQRAAPQRLTPPRDLAKLRSADAAPLMEAALLILAVRTEIWAPHGETTRRVEGPSHQRDTPASRRLLFRAGQQLKRQTQGGEHWQGVLQETFATVWQRAGDTAEAARRSLYAADLYERLGDIEAAERVSRDARDAPTAARLPADALTLRVDVADTTVLTRTDASEGLVTAEPAELSLLRFALDAGMLRRAPDELARLLLAGLDHAACRRKAGRLDVRLLTTTTSQQIPWELALIGQRRPRSLRRRFASLREPRIERLYRSDENVELDAQDIRALQEALNRKQDREILVDGALGPKTREAIVAFQDMSGIQATGLVDALTEHLLLCELAHPGVTILQSERGVDSRGSRSVRQSSIPLERIYRNHGIAARTLDAPTPSELERVLHTQRRPLVHVCAAFVEHATVTTLDLRGDWAWGPPRSSRVAPDQITAATLDQALRGLTPKPIVILDPPAPRTLLECARQLRLRNGFAADLFALGSTRAVLGIGLTSYGQQLRLRRIVVGGLAQTHELGAIVEQARRVVEHGSRDPSRLLGFGAVALFARAAGVRPAWQPHDDR